MNMRPSTSALDARATHPTLDVRVGSAVQEAPSTPGASAARAVEHLQFLDGARGLAASYVVVHHAMYNVPYDSRPMVLLHKLFQYGHFAVDVFIVLSGYCLMLPVARRREPTVAFWRFMRKRALRIVPTYAIALMLCWALIASVLGQHTGTLWDRCLPARWPDALLHLALLHDWWAETSPTFNYVFWSVGVEWKIYFLFPLLVLLRNRRGPWAMALGAGAVGYTLWAALFALDVGNPSPWGSSPYYLGLFAAGMLAADLADKGTADSVRRGRVLFYALSVLLAGVVLYEQLSGRELMLQLLSAPVGAWAATLLFLLRANALPTLRRWLGGRALVALGAMGYSIYLVHAPTLQLVYLALPKLASPLLLALCVGASLLVARVFYLLAERPFHALSRRLG